MLLFSSGVSNVPWDAGSKTFLRGFIGAFEQV